MKESAGIPRGRGVSLPLTLGHMIEHMVMKRLEREQAKVVLESFADPTGIAVRGRIIAELNSILCEAAPQEHISAEGFLQLRTQIVAVCSILGAMTSNGKAFVEGTHPILAPLESEESELEAE